MMTTPYEKSAASARPGREQREFRPDLLPGLRWTADRAGGVDSVDGRWLQWTGQAPGLAEGEGWFDALLPEDAPRVRSHWYAAIASGFAFSARFRVGPGLDGRIRSLIARAEPSLDSNGQPTSWTALAILAPEVEADAFPSAPARDREEEITIFWIASREDHTLASVSPSCERLLGRSVAELTGQDCSWIDLAHPDDRPLITEVYTRRSSGEPVTVDYRLLHRDGSAVHVRDRVLPVLTQSVGSPDRVFGILEAIEPDDDNDNPSPPDSARRAGSWIAHLTEAAGDLAMTFDPRERCESANSRSLELLGIDPASMLGQPLDAVLPGLSGRLDAEELRLALDRREAVSVELRAGQTGRWLEIRAVRVGDGLGLIARDISRERSERLASQEVEERYRLSSEAMAGLIYDWRLDSNRVDYSPGLVSLLGIAPEEAEPTNLWWRDRTHPDDLPRLIEAMALLAADPSRNHYSLEYRVRHRDGHFVDVWDKGSCLRDGEGNLLRVVGTTIDISERREAEQALRDADRMKDEFMGMLAHELRNPLGPILAASQSVLAEPGEPDRALVAVIERQARHMARLIEDLLDISRIRHGKVLVRPEPIDLAELVRQAIDTVSHRFLEHGLEPRFEPPGMPVPVVADPTRLSQCLVNLLDNALKFTEPGGSVVVRLRIAPDERSAIVEVIDSGIGIAPETLPTLFRAYSQADSRRERNQGGLGLGLALVKNLMELQGGRVEASSEGEGFGSAFRLILPLQAGRAEPEPEEASMSHLKDREPRSVLEAPKAGALRVLIVDDRPDMVHVFGCLLRAEGHTVSQASHAEQALELARRERPEVVISDIGLPGPIDGYDLARALRAAPETASALLIAITGYARPDDRDRAFGAGFDEHLTKPLDFTALCNCLSRTPLRSAPETNGDG